MPGPTTLSLSASSNATEVLKNFVSALYSRVRLAETRPGDMNLYNTYPARNRASLEEYEELDLQPWVDAVVSGQKEDQKIALERTFGTGTTRERLIPNPIHRNRVMTPNAQSSTTEWTERSSNHPASFRGRGRGQKKPLFIPRGGSGPGGRTVHRKLDLRFANSFPFLICIAILDFIEKSRSMTIEEQEHNHKGLGRNWKTYFPKWSEPNGCITHVDCPLITTLLTGVQSDIPRIDLQNKRNRYTGLGLPESDIRRRIESQPDPNVVINDFNLGWVADEMVKLDPNIPALFTYRAIYSAMIGQAWAEAIVRLAYPRQRLPSNLATNLWLLWNPITERKKSQALKTSMASTSKQKIQGFPSPHTRGSYPNIAKEGMAALEIDWMITSANGESKDPESEPSAFNPTASPELSRALTAWDTVRKRARQVGPGYTRIVAGKDTPYSLAMENVHTLDQAGLFHWCMLCGDDD